MSRLLRSGFSTGTCAAAAAKAAAMLLLGEETSQEVEIGLPDGERMRIPLTYARRTETGAEAAVRKDAGDDPDITQGATVIASVTFADGPEITLAAGEGVGMVTKPGLSVPPGEPAINPVPQRMIRAALREVTARGIKATLSIPGGCEMAAKTFNPRLGIEGGLSILGTSGRVRPFSSPALRVSLRCSLDVAVACGVAAPVFVPGRIGEKAARRNFRLTAEQIVEVSNEWGFMIDCAAAYPFKGLLALGHPGKLGKLAAGHWNTHSSKSDSPIPWVSGLAERILGRPLLNHRTAEGLFASLKAEERKRLGDALAGQVRKKIAERLGRSRKVAAVLVDMQGEWIGGDGDLALWK